MSIIINYDFLNAVRNVEKPFSGFKIIRNSKTKWIKYNYPVYLLLDYFALNNNKNAILPVFLIEAGLTFEYELFKNVFKKEDIYCKEALERFNELAPLFKNLNMDTNASLLSVSECYDKERKLKIDEDGLPYIQESKYFYVPSIDNEGNLIDNHIVQEHIVGSDTYLLSKGRPEKVLKLNARKV